MAFSAVKVLCIITLYLASSDGKSVVVNSEQNEHKRQISEPGVPRNLMLLEVTTESLFIQWRSPVSDGGSEITSYRVQTVNQRTLQIIDRMIPTASNPIMYNITDLHPYTNFTVNVAAINDEGRGNAITIDDAETLSLKLDIIFNPSVLRDATTINFKWIEPQFDPTETAPVLYYVISYRVNDADEITIVELYPLDYNPVPFFDVSYTIMDAVPNAFYEINITAYNIRGAGTVFHVPSFTLPCDDPNPPQNFMAVSITPFEVQFTWEEPANTGGDGCVIESYTLTITTPSRPDVQLNGDVLSYTLENLNPDSEFEVSLIAKNKNEESEPVTQTGQTPTLSIPPIPSPPTIINISDRSATITWIIPDDAFVDTVIVRYRRSSEDVNQEESCIITNMTEPSKTLNDLDQSTPYTVRIRFRNSVGPSPFSNEATFTTFGDIVISATPMGSVTVGETETIVLECMLEGADVEDGIVYSWEKEGDDTLPSNAEANGDLLTFTDLLPNLSGVYICTATAQQIEGSYEITVEPGAPGEVSDIRVEAEGETIITSWDEAPDNGATITYTVTINFDGQDVHMVTTQTNSVSVLRNGFQEFDDALIDTDYEVIVLATNSAGSGQPVSGTYTIPSGLPGVVSNIIVDFDDDNGGLSLNWDAPAINGDAIVSYTITVYLESELVYFGTSESTSLSATRSELQVEGDTVRTENTEYRVIIVAENERGQSPEASEIFIVPAESAAPPELSCTNMEESIVSLMIDCEVSSVFDFTTLCSYDNQLAQPCTLSFVLRYLDFEPGDHTLFLSVTALDGKTDNITITFTTPLRLSVTCSVVNNLLTCDFTTEIASQSCSFNNMPQINCISPYDIRPLNLLEDDHSVLVFITDVFGQTKEFSLDFSTIPSEAITLSFDESVSLTEGTNSAIPFLFNIIGRAVDDIPFTLRSLTYEAFEDMTGNTVETVFSGLNIPPAASIDDFDASFLRSFSFLASDDTMTTNYDIAISLQEDDVFEDDEGFILYFEFNEGAIDPSDFIRLDTGTRAILVTIIDNDELSLNCMRGAGEVGLSLTVECVASHELINISCSIDALQTEICEFPLVISLLEPGDHMLTITAYSTDDQIATNIIEFTRPPLLSASCSITDTVLSCTTNNEPDSIFCIFDGTAGTACSVNFDLQTINIQVGAHFVRIFVRDIYSQQEIVDISFNIVSDLQIECEDVDGGLTTARVDCDITGGIGAVFFTCSLDGGLVDECGGFPMEFDLLEFTAEEHSLTVTAIDAAGQPSPYEYTFFGIPDLDLICSYEDNNILSCGGNNELVSSLCVFDGQPAIECTFPLEIRLTGLRLGDHTVTVTASDRFGQTENAFFEFQFLLGPINVTIPLTVAIIEGQSTSPIPFSISGQTLSEFPFTVTPLTYSQFERDSGETVANLFDVVPPPAGFDDFDDSAMTLTFNVTPTAVTERYTYDALLEDDEKDENVEGFILSFEFSADQFNPDDYNRLSQTTGITLVTIIDNDGLKLTCQETQLSTTELNVLCNASTEINATCTYDTSPPIFCSGSQSEDVVIFEFNIDILEYSPGVHSVLVMVVDKDTRVAGASISFTTPPLPRVKCGVIDNILTCDSINPIESLICQFDDDSSMPCTSPLNLLLDLQLSLGPHTLNITITDIYDRTLMVPVLFSIVSDLKLMCFEVIDEREYIRGFDCSTSGINEVTYTCTYDDSPPEDCAGMFPVIINVFEYSPGEHRVSVVVEDSAGEVKTYLYTFTGMNPEDYVISVNTNVLTINEDGSFNQNSDLEISESGFSYGDIVLTITPLTYTEYEERTGQDLADIFPRLPDEASESDYESIVIQLTFEAGLESEPPHFFIASMLADDDSESESTEGFVLLLEVDEGSRDPRDRRRINIEESVVLVSIIDDGDEEDEEPTVILGLTADKLAGISTGIFVFILLLITLLLIIIVALTLRKRKLGGGRKGLFRSRSRQSKSSHSSEMRIFHAAR